MTSGRFCFVVLVHQTRRDWKVTFWNMDTNDCGKYISKSLNRLEIIGKIGMSLNSISLGLFYFNRLWNRVYCTFIFICLGFRTGTTTPAQNRPDISCNEEVGLNSPKEQNLCFTIRWSLVSYSGQLFFFVVVCESFSSTAYFTSHW